MGHRRHMNAFWTFIYNFISNHTLGCAFFAAMFVSALPKPGTSWTMYEILYTFLNGVMANLPQTKSIVHTETTETSNTATGNISNISTKENTISPVEPTLVNESPVVKATK